MMEQWNDEGWWEDLRSMEDSARDIEDMGERRNCGAYGMCINIRFFVSSVEIKMPNSLQGHRRQRNFSG